MCASFFKLFGYVWPISSPTSVTVPVKCVVRMKPVTVVVSAFCRPAVKAAKYSASSTSSTSKKPTRHERTPTATETLAAVAGVLCSGFGGGRGVRR